MRYLVAFACIGLQCFTCLVPALGQHSKPDSLEHLLHTTSDYDKRIRLLGELSDYYSYTDSLTAMDYAFRIGRIARENGDQRGRGIAHFYLGGVFFDHYQPDSAILHYQLAERLLEKDTTFLGQQFLARAWYNHGAQYQRKGDGDTFLDLILNRSIPIYEHIGDSLGIGRSFHNVGLVFQNNQEFDRAIFYYKKAIAILKQGPNTPELIDSYSKLAESILYAPVIEDEQRREVRYALRQADSLLQRYPDAYSRISYLNSKGIAEEVIEERLDRALTIYLQGQALAEKSGWHNLSMGLLNRAYYIYDKRGEHQRALNTINRILHGYEPYLMPQDRLVQLQNLTHTYEKLGNIAEAYRVQKIYQAVNDSLRSEEMTVKIHSLEQRFEAKEKEDQILQLNQQMEAQRLSAQRNRLWILLLVVGILLTVGISLAGYNIFRKRQLIAKQQAELLNQSVQKLEQERHISVFAAMLEGQEQERKRLAIDLHDGLGGALSGIKMRLSKVVNTQPGAVVGEELPAVLKQLDASVDELRRIARNMMPETLLKYGLATALRDFCKGLEQVDLSISFQAYGLQEDMPKSIQIMVYRIIQELISNALKHAGAHHILAQCLQHERQLSITVEDDGKGFDVSGRSGWGMGLANVQTRVAYLGGKVDIQSELGVGTTITIELAYETDEKEAYER